MQSFKRPLFCHLTLGEIFTLSTTEAGVLVVGLLAVVVVVAFSLFRRRAKVKIIGPGGTSLDVDASNDPSPAIRADGVKSSSGGLVADDETGRGVDVKNIDVQNDVRLTSRPHDPKD
jgi:hypothetical protein